MVGLGLVWSGEGGLPGSESLGLTWSLGLLGWPSVGTDLKSWAAKTGLVLG